MVKLLTALHPGLSLPVLIAQNNNDAEGDEMILGMNQSRNTKTYTSLKMIKNKTKRSQKYEEIIMPHHYTNTRFTFYLPTTYKPLISTSTY